MFTDEINKQLSKPLLQEFIKKLNYKFDYIEHWYVKDQANRIFGFGGWSYEIINISEVSQYTVANKGGGENVVVNCQAKARISIANVVREGIGFGTGNSKDLGTAQEGAFKGAETDALKRAFVSFGDQFGLALYDKEKRNVAQYEKIDDADVEKLTNLIKVKGVDINRFLKAYKVVSIEDFPENQVKNAILILEKKDDVL